MTRIKSTLVLSSLCANYRRLRDPLFPPGTFRKAKPDMEKGDNKEIVSLSADPTRGFNHSLGIFLPGAARARSPLTPSGRFCRAQLQPSRARGVPGDGDSTEGTGLCPRGCRIPRSLCVPGSPAAGDGSGEQHQEKVPGGAGGTGLELGQQGRGGLARPTPRTPRRRHLPQDREGTVAVGRAGITKRKALPLYYWIFDFTASLMQLLGGFFCLFSFIFFLFFL